MSSPDLHHPVTFATWADPVIDALGHPAASAYVERFWLPILGPSSTWLIRHVDSALVLAPSGAICEPADIAEALGLGAGRGKSAPLARTLARCEQFAMARQLRPSEYEFRRNLPPLTRRQVERLPATLRDQHSSWLAAESKDRLRDRNSVRRMALNLAEVGVEASTIEGRLRRLKVPPTSAAEAAIWISRLLQQEVQVRTISGPSSHSAA